MIEDGISVTFLPINLDIVRLMTENEIWYQMSVNTIYILLDIYPNLILTLQQMLAVSHNTKYSH